MNKSATWMIGLILLLSVGIGYAAKEDYLVSRFKFDSTAADEITGKTMQLVNSPSYATGHSISALSCDGVNEYANLSNTDYNFGTNNFTISFWLYPDGWGAAEQYVIHKRISPSSLSPYSQFGFYFTTTGNFSFRTYNVAATDAVTTTPLSNLTWTHIVGVRNTTGVYLFINGVLNISNAGTLRDVTNNGTFRVCTTSPTAGSYFDGLLDDLRMYNTTLNISEIQDIYNEAPDQRQTIYYFNGTGGNDNKNGSVQAPYSSIAKLMSLSLLPGDIIRFYYGSEYRMPSDDYLAPTSGNSTNRTIYEAYGNSTLGKPIFYGSKEGNSENNWIDRGGNIYEFNETFYQDDYPTLNDVGNIIFNNGESVGTKVFTNATLNAQDEYFYNLTTYKLYFYSTANPATLYSDIEVAQWGTMILSNSKQYISFYNLSLKYSGSHCFSGTTQKDMEYIDNDISFCGGAHQPGAAATTRYANCLEVYGDARNISIKGNIVHDCYDTGITVQSLEEDGYKEHINVNITQNKVYRNRYNIEMFNSNTSSKTENVSITHNTLFEAGYGWSYPFITTKRSTDILIWNIYNTSTKAYNIKDNIMSSSKNMTYYFGYGGGNSVNGQLSTDYNIFYNYTMFNFKEVHYLNRSTYSAATKNETNSIESNPMFFDPANFDFRPMSGSPACGAASDGGDIGAEPCISDIPPWFSHILLNFSIQNGTPFTYDINASDDVGISSYWTNDTNFSISATGLLTLLNLTNIKYYAINISINDTTDQRNSTVMYLNVTEPFDYPPWFTHILQNFTIYNNRTSFTYDINASDNDAISSYSVNDTNFSISGAGLLALLNLTNIKTYSLNISINDSTNQWNWSLMHVFVLNGSTPAAESGTSETIIEATMNDNIESMNILVTFIGLIITVVVLGIVILWFSFSDMPLDIGMKLIYASIIILVLSALLIGVGLVIFSHLGAV